MDQTKKAAGLNIGVGWYLSIPNIIFEPFKGVWFIVKGFNSHVLASKRM